jgi:hypothetical protein
LQTTVNMGVKLLKPSEPLAFGDCIGGDGTIHTSNWELRAARSELQKVATLSRRQLAHGLKQILDAFAVHVEPMIRFNRVCQGYQRMLAKLQISIIFLSAYSQETNPRPNGQIVPSIRQA